MRNEWLGGRYSAAGVAGVVLAPHETEDRVLEPRPAQPARLALTLLLCSHFWLQTADSLERPETVSLKSVQHCLVLLRSNDLSRVT